MSPARIPRRWPRSLGALLLTAASTTALTVTGAAAAADPGIVIEGNARFTVESPTLIRVEYAGDGVFQDAPTLTAVNRSTPAPQFTTSVSNGYRVIQTSALTMRYQVGSGPVNGSNLSVDLTVGGKPTTARPVFPTSGGCAYGVGCEAERLTLSGGAVAATDHTGYTGGGFVAGFTKAGAAISGPVSAVPAAGQYAVKFRYANATGGDGKYETRTVTLTVNGTPTRVSLPTTANWDTWAVSSTTVTLPAGTSPLSITCGSTDTCNVNIDSVAVTAVGAAYPTPVASSSNNLGGYRRGLDGQSGPAPMADGVLSRDGWYLLDDTKTGLLNADGSVTPRPGHGGAPYQDGYFFGYGHDYKQGLRDLRDLTGPAVTLPRSAFGVWFSKYHAYSMADYKDTLLPAFRSHSTPLDVLVVDTDWKTPNAWNGWDFNRSLFPDPKGLFTWAAAQGLDLSLNIHPSIATDDPKYAATSATAGNTLVNGNCYSIGSCKLFDFRDPKHEKAYFDLHTTLEQQYGQPVWWLDQSIAESATLNTDVSPDSYINAKYAARADATGKRGYVMARIGGDGKDYNTFTPGPSGGWADHRSSVHFTGDTSPTWAMLAFQAKFTAREGSGIGHPYVSHDIGGFFADSANSSGGRVHEDLYARWVQLGAFQPILRLHSSHGYRLPWEYGAAAEASATKFLRLRESLVPYTYSLAHEAVTTGVPIVRGLYLNYPGFEEAYSYGSQYTYGDDVLVAPVTTPGSGPVSTTVWFPPGTWTDYFTGKTYTGPGTAQVTTTLDTMPVFLRSGGVLTTRTDYVDHVGQSPLSQVTLDVAAGDSGSTSLYEDDGVTQAYRGGASTSTAIRYDDTTRTVTIGAATGGGFTGQAPSRVWTVKVRNVAGPATATVNGTAAPSTYDATTRTLTVTTGSLPTSAQTTIKLGAAAAAGGPIVGAASARCVDVPNASATDGTQLQLYTCNGTTAQTWTLPGDGTIRALGKCMDVRDGTSADATAVQLQTCNGTAAQQWTYDATRKDYRALGKCLDAMGGATANGTKLIIYTCHGGTNQQWSRP